MKILQTDKKRQLSAQKLVLLIMIIFVIPMMVFLLLYNIYTVGLLNSRPAETGTTIIHVQKVPMEQELHAIEDTMVAIIANDANFQKMQIKDILKECKIVENKEMQKNWFIQSVENKNFLFRVLKKKDVYLMSVFDLDKQIQSRLEQTDPSDCLFFVGDDFTALTQADMVEQHGIET